MPQQLKPTILVIEDEPPLQKFLRVTLASQEYSVIEAATGEQGLRHAAMDRPDLVILDLGLPDLDGVEVTRRLREWSAIPIIVVSARGKEQDKVVALDAGADDYLTKPFGVGELLARVRVVLRHLAVANPETGDAVFELGQLRVDMSARQVTVDRVGASAITVSTGAITMPAITRGTANAPPAPSAWRMRSIACPTAGGRLRPSCAA